jgi:hypothetical protein
MRLKNATTLLFWTNGFALDFFWQIFEATSFRQNKYASLPGMPDQKIPIWVHYGWF